MVTKQQALKYYLMRKKIKEIILRNARNKKHIIYGSRAVNTLLHPKLQVDVSEKDFDIYSKTPEKTARRVERKLDKKFKFNAFETKKAKYPQTHKVMSRVTKNEVVDYTLPEGKIQTVTRGGVRYAKLSHQLRQIKKSLADKESKFRWEKDRETKLRISLNKMIKKTKPKKKTRRSYW